MKTDDSFQDEELRLGLLFLGRKRAGFDPVWGAQVLRAVEGHVRAAYPASCIPSQNISDEAGLSAALNACTEAGVRVLVLVQTTISDGRLALLLARTWTAPLVVWATPEKPTGAAISANSLVGSHVMAANLRHCGRAVEFVYGSPEDSACRAELREAVRVLYAAQAIRGKIFGLVGGHAPGFVDLHADPVFISKQLGSQLYHVSLPEFLQRMKTVDEGSIGRELDAFYAVCERYNVGFGEGGSGSGEGSSGGATTAGEGWEAALRVQARYYSAFRSLMSEGGFDALAFRCWPDLPTETGHWPYLALARLLTENVAIAMEGDVDGAVCSLIARAAGFGRIYLSDWLAHDAHSAVIWHTGAAPLCLTVDSRLSFQFNNGLPTVVDGRIRSMERATIFRLWRFEGEYCMTALEGRTCEPVQERMATNGRFETELCDVRGWFRRMLWEGMPHHVCVVEGGAAGVLERISRVLGFRWVNF